MATKVDARGRSCPEPVLMTKQAIESGNVDLEVIVDTEVAKDNIIRFVKNKGFKVNYEENNNEIHLFIRSV
ncbi:MAG: tRNA 2-thiouridine synthesizing protein [Clostridia bacterium]|nr:putative redox protein [Clostridiales bacterium]MDK2985336.1 tRNA 2-thiouridine synthesizing protein [Clostridia bacterium]